VRTFAALDVSGRCQRAFEAAAKEFSVDALLVTSLDDIRWLTAFSGSSAVLVLRDERAFLITDGRYVHQASDQLSAAHASVDVVLAPDANAAIACVASSIQSSSRCGYDPGELTVRQLQQYAASSSTSMVEAEGVVRQSRRIKTHAEIERIACASDIADAALAEVEKVLASALTQSTTERDVRDELEFAMRRLGADGPSYETIVAAGPNSALPHHRPTSMVLREGHSVVIDVGALVDGYHSDMTRTYLLGECDPELVRMHQLVIDAQQAGLQAVRAGAIASDVDGVCREMFDRFGIGHEFTHGTGHGVGLQIHEMPWLRRNAHEPLQDGEVVTVEPGLYRVGLGGVRIEDLVLVESTGCHVFTHSQKEHLCLRLPLTT
jgi:Xaa-Pro aminopeptidase